MPVAVRVLLGFVVASSSIFVWNLRARQACAAEEAILQATVWPSDPPASCPFQKSTDITGIAFTGRHVRYANADTWYPSWAANGNMYSPWTDGKVGSVSSGSGGKRPPRGMPPSWATTRCTWKSSMLVSIPAIPRLTRGATLAAAWSITACGITEPIACWIPTTTPGKGLNWDILGPFVGFRYSQDYGKTWHDTPHTPADPLFGEPAAPGGKVKMGSPHFVDFGRNMQYSPDGNAYLVGHGAADPDPSPRPANLSWITGDQIYLARVKPGIANMNNRAKYEFFAGYDAQQRPIWTRDFSRDQAAGGLEQQLRLRHHDL